MDAQFLSSLDVRVIDDSQGRPVLELLAPFGFWSAAHETEYWVPAWTQFDGPSIPQIALWATGAVPGLRASCLHDWLIVSRTVERKVADRVFLEALRVCGVDELLARTMYEAVRSYARGLEDDGPIQYGSG